MFEGYAVFWTLRVFFDERLISLEGFIFFPIAFEQLGGAEPGGSGGSGKRIFGGQFVVGFGGGGGSSLAFDGGDLGEAGSGFSFLISELGGSRRGVGVFFPEA